MSSIVTDATITLDLQLGDVFVASVESNCVVSDTQHVHTDHLGGTTLTTDSAGAITQTLDYFAYGETRLDIGARD